MIDTNAKIDKYGLKKYVLDYLQSEVDWYAYGNGGYICTIRCTDNAYTIKFISDDSVYNFEIAPYDEQTANYVISVHATDFNNCVVNGCKHIFTYNEIEKFIYDCFKY